MSWSAVKPGKEGSFTSFLAQIVAGHQSSGVNDYFCITCWFGDFCLFVYLFYFVPSLSLSLSWPNNFLSLKPFNSLSHAIVERGKEGGRDRDKEGEKEGGEKKRKRETDRMVFSCLSGLTHHNYFTAHSLLICSQYFCQHIQFSKQVHIMFLFSFYLFTNTFSFMYCEVQIYNCN